MVNPISFKTKKQFNFVTSEFESHVEKTHYFLNFLNPNSKKPGLLGMISWEALREGLCEQKAYFLQKKYEGSLSLKERDQATQLLSKIEMALQRIS